MNLKEYQGAVKKYALPTAKNLHYLSLGLAAEAGEVAGKVAKFVRDETGLLKLRSDASKELGDCLWFLAMLADHLDLDMNKIAIENLNKLETRFQNGVITGSGDDR